MTLSIDEYNVVVGGVSLNTSWRKTTTKYIPARNSGASMKTIGIEFVIEGDTEEELRDRWQQTQDEFNKVDPEVYCYRSNSAIRENEWGPSDGETVSSVSSVSVMPQMPSTRLSKYCYLEIVFQLNSNAPPSGVPGSPQAALEEADGLVTGIEIVNVADVGEMDTLVCTGSFRPLSDAATVGPVGISSIYEENSTGLAVIEFTAPITPPSMTLSNGKKAQLYADITGTTRYNGHHSVKRVTDSIVVIDMDFSELENAGSVSIGAVKTAEGLFDEAKEEIYQLMGIGENNVILINKMGKNNADGTYDFELTAQEQDFVPGGIGDGHTQLARTCVMRVVDDGPPDEWETDPELAFLGAGPGTVPKYDTIEGRVVFNKDAVTGTLDEAWGAVSSDIFARARIMAGKTLEIRKTQLSYDLSTPAIGFTFTCVENFHDSVLVEKTLETSTATEPYIYARGLTLHGVQVSAAVPVKIYTQTITRVGRGLVDMTAYPAPTESGYVFVQKLESDSQKGPSQIADLGGDFYSQKLTRSYARLKLA